MADYLEKLKSLHTTLIDSRDGYKEALADAQGGGLSPLFSEMISLRDRHHAEIDQCLRALGATPDESGSFLSVVHKTIFKVRSLVGGLDESVLPGLIDGETRIADAYRSVLDAAPPADVAATLEAQLAEVREKRSKLEAM